MLGRSIALSLVLHSVPATGAPNVSYTPGMHAQAILNAYDQALSDTGNTPLARLLAAYSPVMKKVTEGTCHVFACHESRGPTECLDSTCICREGYETLDGETCSRHGQIRRADASLAGDAPAGSAVKEMLSAGAGEPDQMPCPGSDVEMAEQAAAELVGVRVFNVSLCRIAGQKYHGSPLPLVTKDQLKLDPIANGYKGDDNLRNDLYSVHNFRQWRTSLVQTMSKQFLYATALADTSESARRLGNLFHLLSDTFSQSHVNRKAAAEGAKASQEVCESLTVTRPISMDVVNWLHHVKADSAKDIYWDCATLYGKVALTVWAGARLEKVDTAASANKWIDKFVKEVACPALSIDASNFDKPVSGADAYWGSDSVIDGTGKQMMPTGLAAAADAERIVTGWREALAIYRETRTEDQWIVPAQIDLPPRALDACTSLDANHVTDAEVQNVIAGEIGPEYIVPLISPKSHSMEEVMVVV